MVLWRRWSAYNILNWISLNIMSYWYIPSCMPAIAAFVPWCVVIHQSWSPCTGDGTHSSLWFLLGSVLFVLRNEIPSPVYSRYFYCITSLFALGKSCSWEMSKNQDWRQVLCQQVDCEYFKCNSRNMNYDIAYVWLAIFSWDYCSATGLLLSVIFNIKCVKLI